VISNAVDFIVIGAGSAGCVVANRLSAAGGGSVLMLEAGGPSRGLRYRLPLAATTLWFDPRSSWLLMSEPEPGLGGRRIPVPRGKALGGSSAINGTIYNRGSPEDYDRWRDAGLAGWDYQSLLPYFRRIESHWRGADGEHGGTGEVAVTPLSRRSPLTPPVLEAARQMGFPVTEDFIAQPVGIGLPDLNVDRRGRRVSAADAFLEPIRGRTSLSIQTGAQVLRVLFDGRRAVGVEYNHDGVRRIAHANREVLLCGGAIASPQLLLLSGIGNADELRTLDIPVVHDLPAVGQNLNDQPGASFEIRTQMPLTLLRSLRIDRFVGNMLQWALGWGGVGAGPPIVAAGSLRTEAGSGPPDLRLNVAATTMAAKIWYPGFSGRQDHKLLVSVAVAHPESRGSLRLASADPESPPRILYNLLTAGHDIARLRRFYKLAHEFIRQPALAGVVGDVTRPAAPPANDTELDAYLRLVTGTTSHPMGSCRMGSDAASVVDLQCRVRGLERVRVVDASVFPGQISGNPHSAVMMLGDRIADAILGRPPLADAQPQSQNRP